MWAGHRLKSSLTQQLTLLTWTLSLGTQSGVSPKIKALAQVEQVVVSTKAGQTRARIGSAVGVMAGVGALVAVIPGLVLALLLGNQAVSAWFMPAEFWAARLEAVLHPAVHDANGLLMGFLPPHGAKDLDAAHAADPGAVPTACIDLALAREDAHHRSPWRYVRGVDLGSVVRATVSPGGASTMPMQLSRQLAPHWPRKYGRWVRKVLEAGAAGTLVKLHHGNHREIARTYLAVAPFGIAYGDVRGIAAAADALWGIAPSELSPAQCAMLVVLLPRRIDFVNNDTESARTAWTNRVEQARRLLAANPTYAGSAVELAQWQSMPRRAALAGLPPAATLNLGAGTRALVLEHRNRILGDRPGVAPDPSIASNAGLEGSQ